MRDNILKFYMKVSKDQSIKNKATKYLEKKNSRINLDELESGKHFLEHTKHKSDWVFNNYTTIE